jgi:hypothetical protein
LGWIIIGRCHLLLIVVAVVDAFFVFVVVGVDGTTNRPKTGDITFPDK